MITFDNMQCGCGHHQLARLRSVVNECVGYLAEIEASPRPDNNAVKCYQEELLRSAYQLLGMLGIEADHLSIAKKKPKPKPKAKKKAK